jgi:hypothetical protein
LHFLAVSVGGSPQCHHWDVGFILFSLFVIVLARAAHIFPLSLLANALQRKTSSHLSWNYQAMLLWAGLRGAIAFALAIRNTSTPAHQVRSSRRVSSALPRLRALSRPAHALGRWWAADPEHDAGHHHRHGAHLRWHHGRRAENVED